MIISIENSYDPSREKAIQIVCTGVKLGRKRESINVKSKVQQPRVQQRWKYLLRYIAWDNYLLLWHDNENNLIVFVHECS